MKAASSMPVPRLLNTSSWLQKSGKLGSIELKHLSKVNVLSFFFSSVLMRVVWVGEGMAMARAAPRLCSLWLKGRTLTATCRGEVGEEVGEGRGTLILSVAI